MGVSYPATPKIYNLAPKIAPNVPNSERTHPPATSGIVYMYLLVPPTPAQQPRPPTLPRPLIRHPRHTNKPTRLPKRPYYLVFESPVWSGFLVPQGLNRNRNRSTFVPEVKKTGPDRKKTENRG
jgi:hypothetical protein